MSGIFRARGPNRKEALTLWHRINLRSVLAEDPDLTTRQLAILTTVYIEAGPHTVRSLAQKLNVTKAVITRGLDRLERYDFVTRLADPLDKRSLRIGRTAKGTLYLSRFADDIRLDMKQGANIPSLENAVLG